MIPIITLLKLCHPGRRSRSGTQNSAPARGPWVAALRFATAGMTIMCMSAPAAAAELTLKTVMQASGPRITLGDIFEGAGAARTVVVGSAPAGGQAVLDAAQVQVAARRAGLAWANAEGRRRIIVASADKDARTVASPARPSGRAQVLAYARNINMGELVVASDLVWSDQAVAPLDAFADAEQAIGKAARRPLRMGAGAAQHDLGAPRVIRRDEMVQVAFAEDGVSLTLTGKALGDAAVGESVSILNPVSRKTLEATASGPGRALVGPAAERLRLQAFPNLQLASARP